MVQAFITSIILLLPLLLPSGSAGEILKSDTVWKGKVSVADDVVVPRGVTLTVMAGAVVTVSAAESTKTDPEYLSPLTEITVRGKLVVKGTKQAPVRFLLDGKPEPDGWGGIIVDGGTATAEHVRISHAETALSVLAGDLQLLRAELTGNRYGVLAHGKGAAVSIAESRITGNDYGIFIFNGAGITSKELTVSGNRKKDRYAGSIGEQAAEAGYAASADAIMARRYRDDVLLGETVWQGKIEIAGTVRVPEGSRLIVLPGTVVEFRRKDTTGTGIGETASSSMGASLRREPARNQFSSAPARRTGGRGTGTPSTS